MPASIKKEFEYNITNLDWGDGSDLEFVQNPKLFDRLESLEHTYEMPGFYTIKGLVYKKALQMVNIYPPVEEDSSIHYDPIDLDNNDENHDFPNKSPIKALLSSTDEETYLGAVNLNFNLSGSEVTLNPSARGGYLINETFRSGTDVEILQLTEVVDLGLSADFDKTMVVRIPGDITNRLRNAGVRFNMGLELDPDKNNFFEAEFEAWLPNFGRLQALEQSDAPENPPENYLPQSMENALSISQLNSNETLSDWIESGANHTINGDTIIETTYGDLRYGDNTFDFNQMASDGLWDNGAFIIQYSSFDLGQATNSVQRDAVSVTFTINDNYPWDIRDGEISEDGQWLWDGNTVTWNINPNFQYADLINNPTRYLLEIRLTPEDEEADDHREQFFFFGTNDWQTIKGNYFASDQRYKSMYVELRQLDKDLDAPNDTDSWQFYMKNIQMKIQNTNNIKFPLQWERFQSNIVINTSDDYDSPFFEKNDFVMIGGMSKNSYYYKSLSSIIGYDFNNHEKRENFSYAKYNPYDVIFALDTLAKFDDELYDEYLTPYTTVQGINGVRINNGMINRKWHGTFKNTALTDTDITSVRIRSGVKPMWQQLGFDDDEFDIPNKIFYWKNIIPKDFDLSERVGITQRDLPDPMKGSLTPRIPRKEFIVDEEATQNWKDGYYWPFLPKFNKYGGFSDEYPEGAEAQSYGSDEASITSLDDDDSNLIFDLSITDDDIVDTLDKHDVKLNVDFTLIVNSSNRMVKSMEDFSGTVEIDEIKQAF